MTESLRALLSQIDEMDTAVFEAPIAEELAIKLRRHLAEMGDLIAPQLAEREREGLVRLAERFNLG
jgi:hypothetical protein